MTEPKLCPYCRDFPQHPDMDDGWCGNCDPETHEAEQNGQVKSESLQGAPTTVQPLTDVLHAVERYLCRFVGFGNEHQATAAVLWVVHCYVIASAFIAAYLRIKSAAEESGKTTFLEVLHALLRSHAINAVSVSPSAVFRMRDKVGPVALLLDESDNTLAKRQDEGARDLVAIVNAGYRRSATVLRSEGRSFEPKAFKAFGPAAIAGIGQLEPTTESRCIPIVLSRKPRGSLERWISFLVEADASEIADQLEAWATPEVVDYLTKQSPEYPPQLRDRHVEVWWNLFAIADMAGGPWPQRARDAAVALHIGQDDESTYSLGVLLLAHIKAAFEEAQADRLSTAELLNLLVSNEEGPWAKFWAAEVKRDGAPQGAASDLARKLRGFEKPDGKPIKPHPIKLPDGSVPRGYYREDFESAWGIYLGLGSPPATAATAATALASTVAPVAPVAPPYPNGDVDDAYDWAEELGA